MFLRNKYFFQKEAFFPSCVYFQIQFRVLILSIYVLIFKCVIWDNLLHSQFFGCIINLFFGVFFSLWPQLYFYSEPSFSGRRWALFILLILFWITLSVFAVESSDFSQNFTSILAKFHASVCTKYQGNRLKSVTYDRKMNLNPYKNFFCYKCSYKNALSMKLDILTQNNKINPFDLITISSTCCKFVKN